MQSNGYLGAARNAGWRTANGEFVLFMDDDNYAKPNEVTVMIQAALRTKADVVTCLNDYLASAATSPKVRV